MKLLLDTHALVWWWTDEPRLPAPARAAIADPANIIYVSAVSAWEITTKHRIGKWPEVQQLITEYEPLLRRSRFHPLAITTEHALRAGSLAGPHRDPFDRMLIAQSSFESLPIISADPVFATHGIDVLWSRSA